MVIAPVCCAGHHVSRRFVCQSSDEAETEEVCLRGYRRTVQGGPTCSGALRGNKAHAHRRDRVGGEVGACCEPGGSSGILEATMHLQNRGFLSVTIFFACRGKACMKHAASAGKIPGERLTQKRADAGSAVHFRRPGKACQAFMLLLRRPADAWSTPGTGSF